MNIKINHIAKMEGHAGFMASVLQGDVKSAKLEIQEGIRHGVRKVNIDTDIRLAMTAAMRRAMNKNKGEFDPRKFMQAAMEETKKVCIERFEAFGSAGKAARVRPIELDRMAQRYQSGELRQVVH